MDQGMLTTECIHVRGWSMRSFTSVHDSVLALLYVLISVFCYSCKHDSYKNVIVNDISLVVTPGSKR